MYGRECLQLSSYLNFNLLFIRANFQCLPHSLFKIIPNNIGLVSCPRVSSAEASGMIAGSTQQPRYLCIKKL